MGTIYSTLKLDALDTKWRIKKDTGSILSKKELNEREKWNTTDWLKHDFEQQALQNREDERKTELDNKILAGDTLTPEEEAYLEKNAPDSLKRYKKMKQDKKAYEEKLRHCKTKDEVKRLKYETLTAELSKFKKNENNPVISIGDKLAMAKEMLAKSRNIEQAERKFMLTAKYKNMKTETEEMHEKEEQEEKDKAVLKNEPEKEIPGADEDAFLQQNESDTDKRNVNAIKGKSKDEKSDILQEIETAYNNIQFKMSLSMDSFKNIESDKKDGNTKKIDLFI